MQAERLRILHTESSLGWGGQEIRILTEARGMLDRGHRVMLACPREARIYDEAPMRGIETIALPIAHKRLGALGAFRSWLAAHHDEIDVVNTHSSTDSWLVALACASLRDAPAVVRTRHLSTPIDRSPFTRWLYVSASRHVVTTGERIRQQLFRDNDFPLDRMTSVPTGIDLTRYRPGNRHEARAALGLADRPAIGIVATLRGWKGHMELLDAWRGLGARFPDWQLVIVGDGPQREILRKRIADEAIGDRVKMAGNRDDVEVWLRALDVFALPSWGNEGVPQSILQAMASGLPVVSTTVGAVDEAVTDSVTGYLVPPKDVAALEERLAVVMADPTLRARFGKAGCSRARSSFGVDAMLDRMEAVFASATGREPSANVNPVARALHVVCPYNEILPTRSAHDVYVFRSAVALSDAGAQSSLLHGAGSGDEAALHHHYCTGPSLRFHAIALPIIRRNVGLRVTVNAVFNHVAQRWIRRHRPDWVITSVLKQGYFHVANRVPGVRYAHEVHELGWYPGRDAQLPPVARRIVLERRLLGSADLVVVTTQALRDILRAAPYEIQTRIEVLSLAAQTRSSVAPADASETLRLAYIGQLYREQGIELLLRALAMIPGLEMDVIGGKPDEISVLRQTAYGLGIDGRVTWHGFIPPASLAGHAARAGAFVAPFLAEGRMPYVAHTKLNEYAGWGRPVVAPDLPVVREHFASGGVAWFEAGNAASLAAAIRSLESVSQRRRLARELARDSSRLDEQQRARRYLGFLGT